MTSIKNFMLIVLGFLLLYPLQVHAGAGANIHATIYMPTKPVSPIIFKFTPKKVQCMNHGGSPAQVKVERAGLTEVSIGFVESIGSGGCAFVESRWILSYTSTYENGDPAPYTGSTDSTWNAPATGNYIHLHNQSKDTYVCQTKAYCTSTDQKWHGKGTLYIIFSPMAK